MTSAPRRRNASWADEADRLARGLDRTPQDTCPRVSEFLTLRSGKKLRVW